MDEASIKAAAEAAVQQQQDLIPAGVDPGELIRAEIRRQITNLAEAIPGATNEDAAAFMVEGILVEFPIGKFVPNPAPGVKA